MHLSGHLLIEKNSSINIIIAGVCMPCVVTAVRKSIYEFLLGLAQTAEADTKTLVMAGHWNALWTDLDRPNDLLSLLPATDKRNQKAMQQMRMCPAQVMQRSMTYGVPGMGDQIRKTIMGAAERLMCRLTCKGR